MNVSSPQAQAWCSSWLFGFVPVVNGSAAPLLCWPVCPAVPLCLCVSWLPAQQRKALLLTHNRMAAEAFSQFASAHGPFLSSCPMIYNLILRRWLAWIAFPFTSFLSGSAREDESSLSNSCSTNEKKILFSSLGNHLVQNHFWPFVRQWRNPVLIQTWNLGDFKFQLEHSFIHVLPL